MSKITGALLAGTLLALGGAYAPAQAIAIDGPLPPASDVVIEEVLAEGSVGGAISGQFIVTNNSAIYFIIGFAVGNPAPSAAGTERPGWRGGVAVECIAVGSCFAYETTRPDSVEAGNWIGQETDGRFSWQSGFFASPVVVVASTTNGDRVICTTETVVTSDPNRKVGSCSFEVPEPGSLSLLGLGLLGLGLAVRRRYA